jgi:hypothetical protein
MNDKKFKKKLGISSKERREEAWSIKNVQLALQGNEKTFNEKWETENTWFPTWKCPSDYYIWLKAPIDLNPREISGKSRLAMMYRTYQVISRHQAMRLLETTATSLTTKEEFGIIKNLINACQTD